MASAFKRRKHLQAKWKDIVQSFPFQERETYETISITNSGKSRAFNFKSSPNGPFMMIFNAKAPKQEKPMTSNGVASSNNLFPAKLDPKASQSLIKSSKNLRTTREHTLMIETMPTEISKTIQDPLTAASMKGKLEFSTPGLTASGLNLLSPTEYNNSITENNSGKFFLKESKKSRPVLSMQRSASMIDKKTRGRDNMKMLESATLEEDLKFSMLHTYQRILENSRKESMQEESSKVPTQTLFTDAMGKDEISLIEKEVENKGVDRENSMTKGVIVYGRNADSALHMSRSVNLSRKVSRATIQSPTMQTMKSLSPPFRSPSKPLIEAKVSHRDKDNGLGQGHITNIVQERAVTNPDRPIASSKSGTRNHKHRQLKGSRKEGKNADGMDRAARFAEIMKGMQKKEAGIGEADEESSAKGEEREEVNMVDIIEKRRKQLLLEYAETLLLPDPEPDNVLVKIEAKTLMKNSPVKELFTSMPAVSQKLHEDIERAAKDLDQKIERDKNRTRDNVFLSNKNDVRLNEIDIQTVKDEYNKKAHGSEHPDYEKIDSVVSKLKFFIGKVKSVRMSLIKAASVVQYKSGDIIFKQGDYGDLMYIILRGSVNVRIKKATIYGTVDDAIVAVLYDGSHFGEYAMLKTFQKNKKKEPIKGGKILTRVGSVNVETGEEQDDLDRHKEYVTQKKEAKQVSIELPDKESVPETPATDPKFQERSKRAATIEVAESCELLCIPRHYFQAIFLSALQKELDEKVQVLLCLPFFNKLDTQSLAPLANNIKAKIYKMGDVLLQAGDKMDKLTIISRGRCKVALEVVKRNDSQPMHGLRGAMSTLKNLDFGKVDYKCTETNTRERDASKDALLGLKFRPTTASTYMSPKAFGNDKLDVQDGKIITREYVSLHYFIRGDFFGGRGMLEREDIDEYNDPFNKCAQIKEPARLSVIAESSVVEVFELPKECLKFVPNFLLKILIQGLITSKEFDEYDIPKEKRLAEKWLKFKEEELHYAITNRRNTADSAYKKF